VIAANSEKIDIRDDNIKTTEAELHQEYELYLQSLKGEESKEVMSFNQWLEAGTKPESQVLNQETETTTPTEEKEKRKKPKKFNGLLKQL